MKCAFEMFSQMIYTLKSGTRYGIIDTTDEFLQTALSRPCAKGANENIRRQLSQSHPWARSNCGCPGPFA